jgi:hypothetical protein
MIRNFFWTLVIAMAPLTGAIIIVDTIITSGNLLLGIVRGIVGGLLWPVVWAVWIFQIVTGSDSALTRIIALFGPLP